MNVILLHPASWSGEFAKRRSSRTFFLPLGLLAVASPLEKAGIKAHIIDQCVDEDWEYLLNERLKEKPVCVAMSVMTGSQIAYGLSVSRLIKETNPHVPVVWGGVHPTILPEQTVAHPDVDIVVEGEGEETFLELVTALNEKRGLGHVKGICYKEGGSIKRNAPRPSVDLERQPPLAYHLVDVKKYINRSLGRPALNTFTSRGCPHGCSCCYLGSFKGGKTYRCLSAKRVLESVACLKERYGIKAIGFVDDNFFVDRARAFEILEGLKKMGMLWQNLNIRLDVLKEVSDEFFAIHKDMAPTTFTVSIESGSQRILDFLNKNISISGLIEMNRKMSSYDITPFYNFMIGTPLENEDDLRQTSNLILQLVRDNPHAEPRLYMFLPYPGTELYDICLSRGLFKTPESLPEWSTLDSTTFDNRMWLTEKKKRMLEMLMFCAMMLSRKIVKRELSYLFTALVVAIMDKLVRAYRHIARFRMKHIFYGFFIERKIAILFGYSWKSKDMHRHRGRFNNKMRDF
ncbi:MAG TPA: hypothetical protein DCL35_01080 [Candidatus Omnitrophica bacterium]|nr:hypothetical protein [Candidatus Omnitrophota bacterium]